MRKSIRKEERMDNEQVKRAREKARYNVCCYNCGKKGYTASECRNKQKCFNCQGFNHIAADCKVEKRNTFRGRGYRGTSRARGFGRGREKSETTMNTKDEAVMTVRDEVTQSIAYGDGEATEVGSKNYLWLLDSGATSHMANKKTMFDNIENDKRDILLADKEGKKLTSNGKGEVVMSQSSIDERIRLKNVLCVPDINVNLLSVAKIADYGYNMKFDKHGAIIYKNGEKIKMEAVREGNTYYVKSSIINNEAAAAMKDLDVWHQKLGHANKRMIEDTKKKDLVIGLEEERSLKKQCEPCLEGKMSHKTHPRLEERKTKNIMDLWHVDLIRPIKPALCGGKRYIFIIIDDYSRVIFVELLKEKSDAADRLKGLIALKENQSGRKLKSLRSDNGGEFIGIDIQDG